MKMHTTLTLVGIAGLVLTSLVACGSDDTTSSEPSVTAPETEADTIVDTIPDTIEDTSAPDPTAPREPDASPTDTTDTTDATTVTTTHTVTESTAVPPGPGRLGLGLVDCVQFALVAPVDVDAARSLVPDRVEVLVDETGTATFTQVSKTCGDMTIDGASTGPGRFDTQWITIAGPAEQREHADVADHFVLPTDYLYPVSFASDNDAFQAAVSAFGVPMESADLQMDPLGSGTWTGSASGPDGDYSWSVDNATASGTKVYFVHVLERADDGFDHRYDIECPSTVVWGPGAASLVPAGGSALFEAFGAEIVGEGYGVELSCDVTIDRTTQAR